MKKMKLEEIGFYTLNDKRAINLSDNSPMQRCEMLLTGNCNFSCPYCRGFKNFSEKCGTISRKTALMVLDIWINDGLKNVRFSGGEPTLYPHLFELVERCKKGNVSHIAISSNGSADTDVYKKLIDLGVNDFSISLDACCSSFADKMAGVDGYFNKVTNNIRTISKLTYVTVGVVLNEANIDEVIKITKFADELGVSDIRLISSAQYNRLLDHVKIIDNDILDRHPILKYRINNVKKYKNVRGISELGCNRCYMVIDDSVVAGNGDDAWHFPCVINLREGGKAIGRVGPNMRKERIEWFKTHNSFSDRICRTNCLDVCQDYNCKCMELNKNF
jgi:molybdenum cofactor biosynthesis enzyme MoaA